MWRFLSPRSKPKKDDLVFITGVGKKSGKRWFEVAIFDGDQFIDPHDSSCYVWPTHWAPCKEPK